MNQQALAYYRTLPSNWSETQKMNAVRQNFGSAVGGNVGASATNSSSLLAAKAGTSTAAPSGSTSTDGGGSPSAPTVDPLQQIKDSFNARLNLMRAEGDRLRGQAKGVRDEVVGNIGTRYGGLLEAIKTKLAESLAAYDKADRGTITDYAISQGSMNKGAEGAQLKNRALARALGFGNSSHYQNMQNDNTGLLSGNTDKLTGERTGKLTDIKRGVADSNTWSTQKSVETEAEKAALQAQADREYQDAISKSILSEGMYNIDSADAASAAENDARSRLSSVSSYNSNRDNILTEIARKAGAQEAGITSKSAIDEKAAATLANNTAQTGAASSPWSTISNTIGGIKDTVGGYLNNGANAVYDWMNPDKKNIQSYLYSTPTYNA